MEKDDVVEIKERLTKIEVLLSEKVGALEKRVTTLESNQTWISRTIIGAIILGLLAIIGL